MSGDLASLQQEVALAAGAIQPCDVLGRKPWQKLQMGMDQNGRPRGPQMWMSSLVLTIHNFGVPNFDPYPDVSWEKKNGFGPRSHTDPLRSTETKSKKSDTCSDTANKKWTKDTSGSCCPFMGPNVQTTQKMSLTPHLAYLHWHWSSSFLPSAPTRSSPCTK